MKPKVDFAFKEIMMDEKARIGFLSSVLKLDPADIRETQVMNTELRKLHADDKQGILDVRILLNNSVEIDTEIQLSEMKVWPNRALFYLSKMYTDQLKPGDRYKDLKKCVSISILNFDLFMGQDEYYSCFHIREDTRHILYTDKMEFHVIEPKLPLEWQGTENGILLWAKFFDAERKEEFDMLAGQDPYINSAYQHLQVISQDKQKRMEYEARQKAVLDYYEGIEEAEERGIKIGEQRGIKIGEERGIKIGEERGLEIGAQRAAEKLSRKMIAAGFSTDEIVKITDLTAEQVEALR